MVLQNSVSQEAAGAPKVGRGRASGRRARLCPPPVRGLFSGRRVDARAKPSDMLVGPGLGSDCGLPLQRLGIYARVWRRASRYRRPTHRRDARVRQTRAGKRLCGKTGARVRKTRVCVRSKRKSRERCARQEGPRAFVGMLCEGAGVLLALRLLRRSACGVPGRVVVSWQLFSPDMAGRGSVSDHRPAPATPAMRAFGASVSLVVVAIAACCLCRTRGLCAAGNSRRWGLLCLFCSSIRNPSLWAHLSVCSSRRVPRIP